MLLLKLTGGEIASWNCDTYTVC